MLKILQRITVVLLAGVIGVVAFNWYEYVWLKGEKANLSFVSFDGAVFSGHLLLPRSQGPHPTILLLHGSGKASGLPPFVTAHANSFLQQGIAVAVYDKRGSGESGGDFDSATYSDFIQDALSALQVLQTHPAVDSTNIGIMGSSESGWFTPEIAMRDRGVKFIINRAGPPLNWVETNLWEIKHELHAVGLPRGAEMNEFLALRKDIWHYYRDAALAKDALVGKRKDLSKRLSKIDPRWLQATGMRLSEFEQEKFARWVQDIFYSPEPYLRQLDIPMYAVFAGRDQNVPTRDSVAYLRTLKQAQGKQIDLTVYQGYSHGMAKWHNVLWMGYPPDYLESIAEWATSQF